MKIHASAPHFFLADLRRAVRFHVDVLGFDEPPLWDDPPVLAMLSRDGLVVMLNQARGRPPWPNGLEDCRDRNFGVDAVDAFHEAVRDRGVGIVHGPEVRGLYGMKEIGIRDPDGYMLVFAEDLEASDGA